MAIFDLPGTARGGFLAAAAHDGVAGGRVYDTHIAEVARAAGAAVIVTDNRRHFSARCATASGSKRRLNLSWD
jgi:predicted nucleic acid-binding protein